ncbi:uncharacterized protein LOC114721918 [Neltuma alba]|uniref:uncharacterized protein LOC114721918 n=1 Tax=Neltuma alba TaxID=207710 RepID=UPI0010A43F61|nr:uncharacterized protein LOC114721918 [Prosopis alba]
MQGALKPKDKEVKISDIPFPNAYFRVKPTSVVLWLANRSIRHLDGILEDILVKVKDLVFPADFYVLDVSNELVSESTLILGRPFLRTANTIIDMKEGAITMEVGNHKICFNMYEAMKHPYKDYSLLGVNAIDLAIKKARDDFELNLHDDNYLPMPVKHDSFELDDAMSAYDEYFFSLPSIYSLFDTCDSDMIYSDFEISSTLSTSQVYTFSLCDTDSTFASDLSLGKDLLLECADTFINMESEIVAKTNDVGLTKRPISSSSPVHVFYQQPRQSLPEDKGHYENNSLTLSNHSIISPHTLKYLQDLVSSCNVSVKDENPTFVAAIGQPEVDSTLGKANEQKVVAKKSRLTIVKNDNDELIPTRVQNSWRVCIDYRKLNEATRKNHFPLPFIDKMLERLAGKSHYCFLDGLSGYFQIPIASEDQEKTTFTCSFSTFAYRRMPFGLCNAPVYGESFDACLSSLDQILTRCIEKKFVLNNEKCHFMHAFDELRHRLITSPILTIPNWELAFELSYDASNGAVGVILGQRDGKVSKVIAYASKTLDAAQCNYTTIEKELFAIVFALDKFRPYLINSKVVVFTDHAAVRYLFKKPQSKPRLLRWALLMQEFNIEIKDRVGAENHVADHLSQLPSNTRGVDDSNLVCDDFPDVALSTVGLKEPWFADLVNYLTNGQVEVSNREIKQILEKIVKPSRKELELEVGRSTLGI